jgi:hypothetical protein
MSANSQALSIRSLSKILQLGPLNYALVPHDDWGEDTISAIGRHFPLASAEPGKIRRTIHLKRLPANGGTAVSDDFPACELQAILLSAANPSQWQCHCNILNTIWLSAQSTDALWTAPADDSIGALRFHLPWDLLLYDLAELGGGLIHGGMAVHNQHTALFLAPPNGGKSTTLATAPQGWQVLSDDAALIWPEPDGSWELVPLPSWSVMLSSPDDRDAEQQWAQDPVGLTVILDLNKAANLHFERLAPAAGAAAIYRALNEYPVHIYAGRPQRTCSFRLAARLARQIPCWRLDLPLHGEIWPTLEDVCR